MPRPRQGSRLPDSAASNSNRGLQIHIPRVSRGEHLESSESLPPVDAPPQLFLLCSDKEMYKIFSFLQLYDCLESVVLVDRKWRAVFTAHFSLERAIVICSKEAPLRTAQAEGDGDVPVRKYVSATTIERVFTLAGGSATASRSSPSSLSSKKSSPLQLAHVTALTLDWVILGSSLGDIIGTYATSLTSLCIGAFRAESDPSEKPRRCRHNKRAMESLLRQCGSGLRNLLLDPASAGPLSDEVFECMPKLLSVGVADARAMRVHPDSRLRSRNRQCAASGGPVDKNLLHSAFCAQPGHSLLQAVARTGEAFILTDRRGMTVACNQGFCDTFGYLTSEIYGLKWDYLLSCGLTDSVAAERIDDVIKECLLQSESHGMRDPAEVFTAFCRKDGSAVMAQLLLLPDALTSKNLLLDAECLGAAFITKLRAVEGCDTGGEGGDEGDEGVRLEQGSFSLSQRARYYHLLRFGLLSDEFIQGEEEGEVQGEQKIDVSNFCE